jgi:hypothetical protein
MITTATPKAHLHHPHMLPNHRRTRQLRTALLPAAVTLMFCVPALAATPTPTPSVDPYAAFCSNNSDLCVQQANSTPPTPKAYNDFCANNSDLCTVTVRRTDGSKYDCTLNSGANQCPADADIVGGPEYKIY